MLPRELRVGNLVDDYCPRERRLSNHAIVALVGDEVRQVRCTTCDAEHKYRQGIVPSSRRKKPVIAAPPLAPAPPGITPDEAGPNVPPGPPPAEAAQAAAPAASVPETPQSAPAPEVEAKAEEPAPAHAELAFHRQLIRATLPRIEGDVPARPIPEFTMHKPAPVSHGHRHGKPFRPGLGGGQHRPGGKAGFGAGRPGGGPRHGQGQGEPNGNTFGHRGGQGQRGAHGGPGGHGGPQGPRPPRHGFGGKPPRGPKKH
jgi:translation initiation factor IF-2